MGATQVAATFTKPTFVGWGRVRVGGLCDGCGDLNRPPLYRINVINKLNVNNPTLAQANAESVEGMPKSKAGAV